MLNDDVVAGDAHDERLVFQLGRKLPGRRVRVAGKFLSRCAYQAEPRHPPRRDTSRRCRLPSDGYTRWADRGGRHAMHGTDAVYVHPTDEMRHRLCDVLEQLWQTAVVQRHELTPRSAVPLLDGILIAYEQGLEGVTAPLDA